MWPEWASPWVFAGYRKLYRIACHPFTIIPDRRGITRFGTKSEDARCLLHVRFIRFVPLTATRPQEYISDDAWKARSYHTRPWKSVVVTSRWDQALLLTKKLMIEGIFATLSISLYKIYTSRCQLEQGSCPQLFEISSCILYRLLSGHTQPSLPFDSFHFPPGFCL